MKFETKRTTEEILNEIEEATMDLLNQIDEAFDELEGISVEDEDDLDFEADTETTETAVVPRAKAGQKQIEE